LVSKAIVEVAGTNGQVLNTKLQVVEPNLQPGSVRIEVQETNIKVAAGR